MMFLVELYWFWCQQYMMMVVMQVFSGVVTATSFHGDISNATGAAAGLGTALSQTQTDPLNKIYFTDNSFKYIHHNYN